MGHRDLRQARHWAINIPFLHIQLACLLMLQPRPLDAGEAGEAGQDSKAEAVDPLAPGRPHGINGVGGFETSSTVEFIGFPNKPHEWSVIYAFPDRARWSLKPSTNAPKSPMIIQRFGAQSWNTEANSRVSKADALGGRRTTLIQMELRRAVTIWPHGFEWIKQDKKTSKALVRVLQHRPEEAEIGYLIAHTTRSGQLQSIEAFHQDGSAVEELQVKQWRKIEGREWPAEMLLLQNGKAVWKETLNHASERGFHHDLLFTPPDQRDLSEFESGSSARFRHVDLPAFTVRLKPLKKGTPWAKALKLFEKEQAAAQKKADKARIREPRLDTVPAFRLNSEGQPTHLIMRFASAIRPAPKGWEPLPANPAIASVLYKFEELNADMLRALAAALPPSSKLGIPYCRVVNTGGQINIQVYQPALGSE